MGKSDIKKLKLFLIVILLVFFNISMSDAFQSISKEDFYNSRDSTELNTAFRADYFQVLEKEIILEMNKVRADPSKYAELKIKPMLKKFIGKKYIQQNKTYTTKEGTSAVQECYRVLHKTSSSGLLYPNEELSRAAQDHVRDQGKTGVIGHIGNDNSSPLKRVKRYLNSDYIYIGENISYGISSADDIVSFFLINDGMPSRGHRETLLNPKFNMAGVACGKHLVYETMCVIVYGGIQK